MVECTCNECGGKLGFGRKFSHYQEYGWSGPSRGEGWTNGSGTTAIHNTVVECVECGKEFK